MQPLRLQLHPRQCTVHSEIHDFPRLPKQATGWRFTNLTNARVYLFAALCVLLSYILDIVELQHTASESGWPLQSKKKIVCVITETLCFSLAAVAIWRKFLSLWE